MYTLTPNALYSLYLNKKENHMTNQPIPQILITNILDILSSIEISESNGNFQRIVIAQILSTHKHVEDLTIREMQQIIELSTIQYNENN